MPKLKYVVQGCILGGKTIQVGKQETRQDSGYLQRRRVERSEGHMGASRAVFLFLTLKLLSY